MSGLLDFIHDKIKMLFILLVCRWYASTDSIVSGLPKRSQWSHMRWNTREDPMMKSNQLFFYAKRKFRQDRLPFLFGNAAVRALQLLSFFYCREIGEQLKSGGLVNCRKSNAAPISPSYEQVYVHD
jgi:hypothetical protein